MTTAQSTALNNAHASEFRFTKELLPNLNAAAAKRVLGALVKKGLLEVRFQHSFIDKGENVYRLTYEGSLAKIGATA